MVLFGPAERGHRTSPFVGEIGRWPKRGAAAGFDPSTIVSGVIGIGLLPSHRRTPKGHFEIDQKVAVDVKVICHGSGSSDEGIFRTLDLDWREPEFGACSRQEILQFAIRSD